MRRLLTHDIGLRTGALLAGLFLWPALARETTNSRLNSIQALVEAKQFKPALEEIQVARTEAREKGDVMLSLYEGISLIGLHHKDEGREVLLKVLTQKPDVVAPPKIPPEFRQELEALRPEIKIRQLREKTQYELALNEISTARRQNPGQDEEVRLRLYEGILLYESLRKKEALEAFHEPLSRQSDAQLPVEDVSPKIKEDFEHIREQVKTELEKKRHEGSPTRYAWIPAVAGGAVAMAGGGLALSATQPDAIGRQTVGLTMIGVGVASVLTAVTMYALNASQSTHASIGVGTNGTAAFVSVSMKWP